MSVIEEDIESLKVKVESLEKLVNLKDMEIELKDKEIKTKKSKICDLKMSLNNSRFVQLDGHGLDLATTDTENKVLVGRNCTPVNLVILKLQVEIV